MVITDPLRQKAIEAAGQLQGDVNEMAIPDHDGYFVGRETPKGALYLDSIEAQGVTYVIYQK